LWDYLPAPAAAIWCASCGERSIFPVGFRLLQAVVFLLVSIPIVFLFRHSFHIALLLVVVAAPLAIAVVGKPYATIIAAETSASGKKILAFVGVLSALTLILQFYRIFAR
jgi:hypothetical protein